MYYAKHIKNFIDSMHLAPLLVIEAEVHLTTHAHVRTYTATLYSCIATCIAALYKLGLFFGLFVILYFL